MDVKIAYSRSTGLFRLMCADHAWEVFVRGEADALREAEEHEERQHGEQTVIRTWDGQELRWGTRAEFETSRQRAEMLRKDRLIERLQDYAQRIGRSGRHDTWPCCGGIRPFHVPPCEDVSYDPCTPKEG